MEAARDWKQRNPEKVAAQRRRRNYGISDLEFNELLVKQGGLCAICKKESVGKKTLDVDHDHDTGEIRGLLCFHCNTGLGHFRDSAELLQAAKDYLTKT